MERVCFASSWNWLNCWLCKYHSPNMFLLTPTPDASSGKKSSCQHLCLSIDHWCFKQQFLNCRQHLISHGHMHVKICFLNFYSVMFIKIGNDTIIVSRPYEGDALGKTPKKVFVTGQCISVQIFEEETFQRQKLRLFLRELQLLCCQLQQF